MKQNGSYVNIHFMVFHLILQVIIWHPLEFCASPFYASRLFIILRMDTFFIYLFINFWSTWFTYIFGDWIFVNSGWVHLPLRKMNQYRHRISHSHSHSHNLSPFISSHLKPFRLSCKKSQRWKKKFSAQKKKSALGLQKKIISVFWKSFLSHFISKN